MTDPTIFHSHRVTHLDGDPLNNDVGNLKVEPCTKPDDEPDRDPGRWAWCCFWPLTGCCGWTSLYRREGAS